MTFGKFKWTDEEWNTLKELGKGITEKNSFFPKDEGHHSDCSGKGPANTFLPRVGHEMIHGDNKDSIKSLDYSLRGFGGDSFTSKLGNIFHDKDKSPSYIDVLTGLAHDKIGEHEFEIGKRVDKSSIQWPSILNDPKPDPFLATWPNVMNDYKIEKEIPYNPVGKWPAIFDKPKEDPIAKLVREGYKKLMSEPEIPEPLPIPEINLNIIKKQTTKYSEYATPTIDKELFTFTQKHWEFNSPELKSWQAPIIDTNPSLIPNKQSVDPYLAHGNKIVNDLIEKNNTERIESYKGLGSAESDILEKGRRDSLNFTPGDNSYLLNPPLDTGGWKI